MLESHIKALTNKKQIVICAMSCPAN